MAPVLAPWLKAVVCKTPLNLLWIAGGTGALFAGASAKFGGTGTFSEGVSKAFADPGARLSQTLSGAGQTFTGQGVTGQGKLFSEYTPNPQAQQMNNATQLW